MSVFESRALIPRQNVPTNCTLEQKGYKQEKNWLTKSNRLWKTFSASQCHTRSHYFQFGITSDSRHMSSSLVQNLFEFGVGRRVRGITLVSAVSPSPSVSARMRIMRMVRMTVQPHLPVSPKSRPALASSIASHLL